MGCIGLTGCVYEYKKDDGERCSISTMTPLYVLSMGKKGLLCHDGPTIGSREWKLLDAENEAKHAASQASEWSDDALSDLRAVKEEADHGWWNQVEDSIVSVKRNASGSRNFANVAAKAANMAKKLGPNTESAKSAESYAQKANISARKAESAFLEAEKLSLVNHKE